ncbi:hypothetical protein Poli38472_003257 [Pythium oligandrum]|uniref:RWD domain-containing protein n=1 Tax=Pythium oligandrum TaxID=41045 RepID=A0A8K1FF59_PYTOL|nr:hypothetical protein Poli38472_003257 [Pythium oligandrum]|eukprot:TMW57332.1 hypothetical protein Poli38472_003257 [Pythium oligandrum]
MTDYKEEQAMEVEALESIYMDEFVKLTDDPLSYQIHIVPNQDGQNNHVALTLKCKIPETYPDVEPQLEIVLDKGLSDTQHKEIKALVMAQVAENLGMAMMFTISEAVREYLVENNRQGNDGSEYQEMMRRLEIRKKQDDTSAAAAAEENAQATAAVKRNDHGTPVTVESFLAWRAKFEAETQVKKKETTKDEATAKLTGKQLWSSGLVDEGTEFDDEDDEDYVEGEDDEEEDDEEDDEEKDGGK